MTRCFCIAIHLNRIFFWFWFWSQRIRFRNGHYYSAFDNKNTAHNTAKHEWLPNSFLFFVFFFLFIVWKTFEYIECVFAYSQYMYSKQWIRNRVRILRMYLCIVCRVYIVSVRPFDGVCVVCVDLCWCVGLRLFRALLLTLYLLSIFALTTFLLGVSKNILKGKKTAA